MADRRRHDGTIMTGGVALHSRMAGLVFQALPLLLIALAWETAAQLKLLPVYVIPPLSSVAFSLVSIMREGFAEEVARSTGRLAVGLSGAVIAGLTLGITMARSDISRSLLQPILRSLYPLPKTALIPIVILWF